MDYTVAVQEARELTREKGYTIPAFMLVLNLEAKNDSARLRRAAAILTGLVNLPPTSVSGSGD